MNLFKKTSAGKLTHKQAGFVALMCGGMAVLLLAAVFVAGGGKTFPVLSAVVSPQSQIAGVGSDGNVSTDLCALYGIQCPPPPTTSYTWTAPPGVTSATVTLIGGGGGGAGGAWSQGSCSGDAGYGGGGGSGGVITQSVSVTPYQTYTVTVGGGGAGGPHVCGSGAGQSGTSGINSSFGGLLTAYGGGGGGGGGGAGAGGWPNGGAGGSAGWYCSGNPYAGSNGTGYGTGGAGACGSGDGANGAAGYVSITPNPPYPTQTISATPASISNGAATTINVAAYPGAGFDACYVGGGPWGGGVGVGTSGSFGTGPLYSNTQFWYQCHDVFYGWIAPVYVTVSVAAAVSVSADITGPSSVMVGQSATLLYHADSTDPPTQCEINGAGNIPVLVNVSSCTSAQNKSYTTTVYTTPGTYDYYFYYNRRGWNFVKSVYVTVVAACPNGTGAAGSCTACNSGYTLSGGSCILVPDICTDIGGAQSVTPTGCQVPVPSPGSCIPSGYTYSGSQCVLTPPSIGSFSASPTRVRKNTPTTVTFSYLVTNPGASCTISGPAGFTAITINPVSAVAGTRTASVTLPQASYFTLTCGAVSAQTRVNLIPATQEI